MFKKLILKYKKDKLAFLIYSATGLLICGFLIYWNLDFGTNKDKGNVNTQNTTITLPDPIEGKPKFKRELQEGRIITHRELNSTLNEPDFIDPNIKIEGATQDGLPFNSNDNIADIKGLVGPMGSNHDGGAYHNHNSNSQRHDILEQTKATINKRDSMTNERQIKERESRKKEELKEKIAELETKNKIYEQRAKTAQALKKDKINTLGSSSSLYKQDAGVPNTEKAAGNGHGAAVRGLNVSLNADPYTLSMVRTLQESAPESRVLAAGKGYSVSVQGVVNAICD